MKAGGKREVARMAWPLAVGLLSFTVMGVVDTLLMGRVGTAAQAGVGLGVTLCWTFQAFFRGLVRGSQSLVAAADGRGCAERVSLSASAALWGGLVSGLVAATLMGLAHAPLVRWVVADPEVAENALAYLAVRTWQLPLSLLAFGALTALQGAGETRTRMWVSLAGSLTNVVLDVVLIFGLGPVPAMGATGAALATLVSTGVMAALFLVRFVQVFGWPRLPGVAVLRSALLVGLPDGVQCQLHILAFTAMNLALARMGAEHLAASQVVLQLSSVSFLPGVGVAEAGGVLVGRRLGAGRADLAAATVGSARTLALWLMGAFGVLFAVKGAWLASWFSQDPRVLELAGTLMLCAAAFQLSDAAATVHLAALRGAGDTRFTLVATSLCAWGLLVPCSLGLGLGLGWGATGAWLGLVAEVTALAALTGWRVAGLGRGEVGRMDLLLGKEREAERTASGRLVVAG